LGFLASEELLDEGEHGNAAFLDQRAAYNWVKKYIHKFGGDGSKITIMYVEYHSLELSSFSKHIHLLLSGAKAVVHKLSSPSLLFSTAR
jgi:hypothetical protein